MDPRDNPAQGQADTSPLPRGAVRPNGLPLQEREFGSWSQQPAAAAASSAQQRNPVANLNFFPNTGVVAGEPGQSGPCADQSLFEQFEQFRNFVQQQQRQQSQQQSGNATTAGHGGQGPPDGGGPPHGGGGGNPSQRDRNGDRGTPRSSRRLRADRPSPRHGDGRPPDDGGPPGDQGPPNGNGPPGDGRGPGDDGHRAHRTGVYPGEHEASGRKRKEKDKVTLPPLPRSAADCKHWLRSAYTAITAASYDPELSIPWIANVSDQSIRYADLYDPEGEPTLDTMIRGSINSLMTGDNAKKVHELVAELQRAYDIEWAKEPHVSRAEDSVSS